MAGERGMVRAAWREAIIRVTSSARFGRESVSVLLVLALVASLLSVSLSFADSHRASAEGTNLVRVSTDNSGAQLGGGSGAPSVANGGNLVAFAALLTLVWAG
jgi:hypothetical protein